jgi:pyruvate/2-oxoglutarate dehydrogenase complex dihydrolipoamide dehydrogenase (E3) component
MMQKEFDVIVIGAGQGSALARMLAMDGSRVALIEKAHVGGSCINIGCTPTKTLFYSAQLAHQMRRCREYGIEPVDVKINWLAARKRKRDLVKDFRDEVLENLQQQENLELIFGAAKFLEPKTIAVQLNAGGTRTVSAPRIVIAAGTRHSLPPIDGLKEVPYLDEDALMEIGEIPKRLLVLGGGTIGVELGQIFSRFGAKVTIIESGEQLLQREDSDIAEALQAFLEGEGLEIRLSTKAKNARRAGDEIEMQLEAGDGSGSTLRGTHLLVATGRRPNSDLLALKNAGIETDDKGFICADEFLETNVPGVFVLGDIKGGPQFTHIAYDDARKLCARLSENQADNKAASVSGRFVPYVVFCDPQLGRIGLSEQEARAKHLKFRVATLEMTDTARGVESGQTLGFWKVLIEDGTDQILGAALLSLEGGEIMAVLETAMMSGLPYTALRDGIFAHPTLAESLNNLFLKLDRAHKPGRTN